jgi:V8-like Glu-specific endopeptidase
MQFRLVPAALAASLSVALPASADEGMWTFDNFPRAAVKQKYGVDITDGWLSRIQRSITRHETGCTGSFVSPQGLVLTNHHCVMSCLADLSSKNANYVADGFVSNSRQEELKCPGEIISVLMDMEDITPKVAQATAGLTDAKANEARKATLSKLEAECTAASQKNRKTGPLACEAVNLYQGGQYFLYKYKRYDDVRMVFAPHDAIAAFGGDPDNFNFPRWSLDFSLLRVYENGKPAATPNHLQWRLEGPQAGEPVFVAGHPGTTNRLWTTAQLEMYRNTYIPAYLLRNTELRGRLIQWSKTGDEPVRITQETLLRLENGLKVYRGLHRALLSDELMAQKSQLDQTLRSQAQANPQFADLGDPWAQIERAQERYRQIYDRYAYLELAHGFNSRLFGLARTLVRGAAERAKPNHERLREFADSNLQRIATDLFNEAPIYPEYEQLTLSFSLDKMRENLGPDDPIVRKLLSADSPDSLAQKLIAGTKLTDPKARRALWEGGQAAVAASDDPFIALARDIDAEARTLRKTYEDEVQAPTTAAQEKIAKVRFASSGTNTYPDATFTLRLSYGAVESWKERGEEVPNFSRLERLYERTTGSAPFALPQLWLDARAKLDPNMPFNYVTTNDIIGGNSGSPVIDGQGRLVGLAFDGNIHSLSGTYWYDKEQNRMVAVHPQIMMTALQDVYGAKALAAEIRGGK